MIIIDDGITNDDCAAFRKSIKSLAEKHLSLGKISIMKDVTRDDDINFRQRILEEISSLKPHSSPPPVSNRFPEVWLERGMGMGEGENGGYHALS